MVASTVDSLVQSKVFNFNSFSYGIAYDEVECGWLERLIRFKKKTKRFWIYTTPKYSIGENEPTRVLFKLRESERKFEFYPPHYECYSGCKIAYWRNMEEPVDILEGVKAKLDRECLQDHTVFDTRDLNW